MPADSERDELVSFHAFKRAHARGQATLSIDADAIAGPGIRAILPRYYMVETLVKGALLPCMFILLALALIHADKSDLSETLKDPKDRFTVVLIVVLAIPYILFGRFRSAYLRRRILNDEQVYRRAIEVGAATVALNDR